MITGSDMLSIISPAEPPRKGANGLRAGRSTFSYHLSLRFGPIFHDPVFGRRHPRMSNSKTPMSKESPMPNAKPLDPGNGSCIGVDPKSRGWTLVIHLAFDLGHLAFVPRDPKQANPPHQQVALNP